MGQDLEMVDQHGEFVSAGLPMVGSGTLPGTAETSLAISLARVEIDHQTRDGARACRAASRGW